jgi:hypothetical protein
MKVERHPLAEGAIRWKAWLAKADDLPGRRHALLEFMPDDDPASLPREAGTLIKLLKG